MQYYLYTILFAIQLTLVPTCLNAIHLVVSPNKQLPNHNLSLFLFLTVRPSQAFVRVCMLVARLFETARNSLIDFMITIYPTHELQSFAATESPVYRPLCHDSYICIQVKTSILMRCDAHLLSCLVQMTARVFVLAVQLGDGD